MIRLTPTQLGLVLGAALWPGLCAADEFGTPIATVYTADDIGADSMGWVTVQDQRGIMHFGCNALVSFDGDHWRSSAIGDTYALRGLDLAPGGKLWAAAVDEIGWFAPEPDGGWKFHSLRPQLPESDRNLGEVWNAFALPGGAVFVSHDRVLWWNGRTFTTAKLPGARRLPAMRAQGAVYVHHLPTGLYRIDRGSLELVIPAQTLKGAIILGMEPRAGGGWTLVTSQGLAAYRAGTVTALASEVSDFVRANSPTGAVRLPDGRLAIGTLKGGLILADAAATRIEHHWGAGSGLPTNEIFSLACDREGGLWITSASSIIRMNPASPDVVFDHGNGLPDGPYLSFAALGGKIAAATDEQIFLFDPAARKVAGLNAPRGHIWALQTVPGGVLVARNLGLDLLTAEGVKTIFQSDEDVFTARPSIQRPPKLWISTGRQLVQLDQRSGAIRTVAEDLPDIVTTLAEGRDSRLWCGTTNAGVLVISAGAGRSSPRSVGPERGLPSKIGPVAVTETSDGTVLALSLKGGWSLDPARDRFYRLAGYPPRRVGAFAIPREAGLAWLVHPAEDGLPACVAAVRLQNGRGAWSAYAVDGLWKIGTPTSLYAEPAGKKWALWVGGTAGLLRLELDPDSPPAPVTAPLITVLASGPQSPAYRPAASTLSYALRDIRMEFAIPSYSHPAALRLETKLEGIDRSWVSVGAPFVRDLPALSEGRYRVLARTVDADGRQSVEALAAFAILPPFWRSWPIELGLSLALIAAGAAVFRWRLRSLRERTEILESMVRSRTEQLTRANQAKTDFVAHISHNIRNPLNGLLGMTVALEDTRLNGRQKQMLGIMKGCGDYLATLIDNVIDFAKIEAGQIELHLSAVGITEILDQVAAVLKGSAGLADGDLALAVAADLPPLIVTDPSRLKEILVNYATNARKHAGGRIELGVRRIRSRRGEIEFSVKDYGPGLAMDTQAVLFTRFGRLPGPPERTRDSTGIGLFVCQRLAEAMGGAVGVESEPGRGARFFVRFPLISGQEEERAEIHKAPPQRVLLVEDTDYNAWAAAAVLARLGLQVSARARNGREALELLRHGEFDLILLDRSLPDMDGKEVAAAFRRLEEPGKHAWIVGVTAYSTAEDKAASLLSGMDAFVGKPLTPEKLGSALGLAGGAAGPAVRFASADAPGSIFQPGIFRELSDGSAEGVEREKARYLAHLADDTRQLREALAAKDPAGIRLAAHRLRADASVIEARALGQRVGALERAAAAEFSDEMSRLGGDAIEAAEELIRQVTVAKGESQPR